MLAAEHVLCYLRGTWNQTIRYSRDSHNNPNVLWGWVDADWAGVSVASPICVYPTPQNVGVVVRITRVANCLIPGAAQIAQNVYGSKHVILAWKL